MKIPKDKIKSKFHHHGHYGANGKAKRKPTKGAFGAFHLKALKVLDTAYSIDDYVANHPQAGSIPPQELERAMEEAGFLREESTNER